MAEPGHCRCRGLARRGAPAILPGILLVLMPKCPACVAGYVALFTGASLSFPAAGALRLGLMALCGCALVFFMARAIAGWRNGRSGITR